MTRQRTRRTRAYHNRRNELSQHIAGWFGVLAAVAAVAVMAWGVGVGATL